MAKIQKNHLVTKQNALNEMRACGMTLQELRFFSIYLSRIDPRDPATRVVRFSVSEFQAIMELGSDIKIEYMKKVTDRLLRKIITVPLDSGGYCSFHLFKECAVDSDAMSDWYVEINAHDKALPYLFEYQSRFFSYQLWNALRLTSVNQLRMYEILKQYESIGTRVIHIDELKELLGIKKDEYAGRYDNFKLKVLDVCQKALEENTDITFTYDAYGKRGKGGKVSFFKFTIKKNEKHVDPLALSEFIGGRMAQHDEEMPGGAPEEWPGEAPGGAPPEGGGIDSPDFRQKIEFLMEACDNEFSYSKVVVLYNEMRRMLPHSLVREDIRCYDYLSDKYREMLMRDEQGAVRHRFEYLRSIIGKDREPVL